MCSGRLTRESIEKIVEEIIHSQEEVSVSRVQLEKILDSTVSVVEELFSAKISPPRFFESVSHRMDDTAGFPKCNPDKFHAVPLPEGLTREHLENAMNYTVSIIGSINKNMMAIAKRPLCQFIQANNFSGIVSNILTDALDRFSPYKHNHSQRYPDLKNSDNGIGLEIKATNKLGKGGESHNAHGGWHLIACFQMDEQSGNIRFVQIEIAELISFLDEPDGDWKYQGSKVNQETGSQRTETYSTTNRGTWKLRDGSVYLDADVTKLKWRRQGVEIPRYSPFFIDD